MSDNIMLVTTIVGVTFGIALGKPEIKFCLYGHQLM